MKRVKFFSALVVLVMTGIPAKRVFADTMIAPFFPLKPSTLGLDLMAAVRDFADVIRDGNFGNLFDDPALTAVTREFGQSVISMNSSFPMRSGVAAAEPKPWSSWWFPKKEDYLFKNEGSVATSPLSKYDWVRVTKARAAGRPMPGLAADYEKSNYNEDSLPWEGLCDAWALAAISSREPKRPVKIVIGGYQATFSVGDLKALLLKTYEAVDDSALKYYGQKFTGDYHGWIYPDIFPDQFHRFVEVQLFQNKQHFIMDHDAGLEVWNVPVYKANYVVDVVPENPNAVFVRMWLYSAESIKNSNEKDFVGTKETVREYDYVLTGQRNSAGDLVVNSGYWVQGPDGVDSRKDHPDYLTRIPDPKKLVRKSWNPEIDVQLVDEIIAQSY